jgi:hypothetical protein
MVPPPEVKPSSIAENIPGKVIPLPPDVKSLGAAETVPGKSGQQVITPTAQVPKIPVSPPQAKRHSKTEILVKEIVEVKQGFNLYSLGYQYYKAVDETFIDHILKLNPEITNPNLILIGQKIKIPEITESLLIGQNSDGLYTAHLRTFINLKSAGQYKRNVGSMGKEIAIVPWKVSPGETWYRVMAGPFASRDEAAHALEEMKQKGFSINPERSK